MDKKLGLLLIFVFLLVIIASVAFFLYSVNMQGQGKQDPENINTTGTIQKSNDSDKTTSPQSNNNNVVKPVLVKKDIPVGQFDLERMAKSFAERFGSFSNQSNYANISDLDMFMSENMKRWASEYVEKNKKNNLASEIYFGITTKSLSAEVREFDETEGMSEVMVQTRRREAVGTTNNSSKLYNQDILISFTKESGVWKVDSAYWQ